MSSGTCRPFCLSLYVLTLFTMSWYSFVKWYHWKWHRQFIIISIFTCDQIWPLGIVVAYVCVSVIVYYSPDCPHDNSSSVQTNIIKFGPEVHNNLVKAPVGWGESDPNFQGQIYLKIQFLSNTWDDCD